MSEELKPCQHCGYVGGYIGGEIDQRWITCGNKDCLSQGPVRLSDEEAIKAWNTRASGWISVDERLPDSEYTVLCYRRETGDYFSLWVGDRLGNMNETFGWYDQGEPTIAPTHWMPLPEPPKRFHVEYCPECEHPVWDDAVVCPNCKFEGKMCKFKPDKWSEAIY